MLVPFKRKLPSEELEITSVLASLEIFHVLEPLVNYINGPVLEALEMDIAPATIEVLLVPLSTVSTSYI